MCLAIPGRIVERPADGLAKVDFGGVRRTVSTAFGPYYVQESLHPNYWAQLATRSCLRQAYAGGAVRGGACVRTGSGLSSRGEPVMSLR